MAEVNVTSSQYHADLNAVLDAVVADLTAIRAAVLLITAKLDADGGVTDTNYAATCNPAALTTTVD